MKGKDRYRTRVRVDVVGQHLGAHKAQPCLVKGYAFALHERFDAVRAVALHLSTIAAQHTAAG